jgi:small GTP-binding protein
MYLVRVIIVGDTGVGKTSLLVRFHENNFSLAQKTTIGVDYKAKEINIEGEIVKLQIWDTAGQERFRSMTAAFYNRAQGVIVAFDVTNPESFLSLGTWINDVKRDAPPGCFIVLCANKTELPVTSWKVSREEFTKFSEDNNLIIFETSAATGQNVNEMFMELGKEVVRKIRAELSKQSSVAEDDSVKLSEGGNGSNASAGCC